MKTLKIIFILGFCVLAILNTYSQDSTKIKIQIGGLTKLDFKSTESTYEQSLMSFKQVSPSLILNFSPSIAILIYDGVSLGIEIPMAYSNETDIDDNKTTTKSISCAPYFKKYIGKRSLKPFIYGTYGMGFSSLVLGNHTARPIEFKLTIFGVYGGIAYFFNKNVSLETAIGYGYESIVPIKSKYYEYPSTKTSGINTRIGLCYIF